MDVVPALAAALHAAGAVAAPVDSPAATGGNAPELFDVDVQQVPGPGVLIAPVAASRAAYHRTGELVDVGQPGQPLSGDDPPDRAGRQPKQRS